MRIHNFNAGPAALPLSVLERAQAELLDFKNSGMSIMEHSHRGKQYDEVHHRALSLLRELLAVPDTHDILFMQGGGHLQFALVPMHFLTPGTTADYVVTGGWSEKALEEAQSVGKARSIPTTQQVDPSAAYVHTTSNNTLEGTQFHPLPQTGAVPHICDMSSDLLWAPIPVDRFALIYAAAQKNVGPSGVSVVIAKKDFIENAGKHLPPSLRYQTYAKAESLYNTPPTFAIYIMMLMLEWTKSLGGLAAMEKRNREKAAQLYGVIDEAAGFYRSPAAHASRSFMNVVFRLPSEKLEEQFLEEGKKAGLVGMKGHRSVGGMRASIYNPVEPESVAALASFMRDFARRNG